MHNTNGIKLGAGYKEIYKDFVAQTTLDISTLIKKWKNRNKQYYKDNC